jgi:hypothetical protein
MFLVPPEDYDDHDLSITIAGSSQPMQPARKGRGGTKRGRGAGTRRQSTALPPNSFPNANNVSVNLRRYSGYSFILLNQQQPFNTVTLLRTKFEIL